MLYQMSYGSRVAKVQNGNRGIRVKGNYIIMWLWHYCITLKFREHLIFAQIRESVRFAKIKCSRKFSIGPQLSETFYGIEIGQFGAKLHPIRILHIGQICR